MLEIAAIVGAVLVGLLLIFVVYRAARTYDDISRSGNHSDDDNGHHEYGGARGDPSAADRHHHRP